MAASVARVSSAALRSVMSQKQLIAPVISTCSFFSEYPLMKPTVQPSKTRPMSRFCTAMSKSLRRRASDLVPFLRGKKSNRRTKM